MAKADEDRARRIEDLVSQLENISDPESRRAAERLMEAILELHGAGLERIMEIVSDSGEGQAMIRRLAADDLVSSLLVLHGLHPDDMGTRIRHALSKAKLDAELTGVFEDSVRVRLTGNGCGLKEAVDAVIRNAAPDAAEIVIEEHSPSNGFVPLDVLATPVPRRV